MINNKKFTKVGIIGFGGYVPKYRIRVDEIAKAHGKDGEKIANSLGVKQKAVAGKDEDIVSLSVEAGKIALKRAGINSKELGAILIGSESHVYAVKPTGSIVADILGIGSDYVTADLEFACKAGTSGLIMIASMIEGGLIDYGMAIGADVAQSKPGDVLEYTAGAGAGAIILGNKKNKWKAKLNFINSFNSDTPDFWRREGMDYPEHAGRFTGEPGYFEHVIKGTEKFLKKTKQKINGFKEIVFHMPNGKFPKRASKRLGVNLRQIKKGFIVNEIGNPYSGSTMLGLIKILEETKNNGKVLLTSYGSGAGSDTLSFSLKNDFKLKMHKFDLKAQFNKIEYINYSEYLLMRGLV